MASPRCVFDCMIFLQGAARPNGPAAALLQLAEAGHVDLYVSESVLAEVRGVLSRRKIVERFPSLTAELVDSFIDSIRRHSTVVAEAPVKLILERDPKDEKYLNLAVAVSANYLVSRDKDLLELVREAK